MPALQAIIIGAGIAGLSTAIGLSQKGCRVIVLEKTAELRNIGGGIQLRPNASRVLVEYGLKEAIESEQELDHAVYHMTRYENAATLCEIRGTDDETIYGAPHWGLSRGSLQNLLAGAATARGAEIRFGCKIDRIDWESPSVHVDGEELHADFVVGADGINSMTRAIICPDEHIERQDLLSAYYITVPRTVLSENADTRYLLDAFDFCLGPGKFIFRGSSRHDDIFFMLLMTQKLLGETGVWDRTAKIEDVMKEFSSFHESILKGLKYAKDEDCFVWRVSDLPPLSTWRSMNSKVAVIGDAAHAILPTGAQGAAMAIEDSAALAECVARAEQNTDIPKLLEAFETIRRPRTDFMTRFARARREMFCMPDGPAQEKRDAIIKAMTQPQWDGEPIDNPPALGTPMQEHYVRSYKVVEDTNKQLNKILGSHI